MSDQELLRVWPDVGHVLKVGRSTAYELVRSGDLPVVRIGKTIVRVRREDLDSFIRTRMATS